MDQRRQQRKHLIQYLQAHDAQTSAHLGNLVDLTTEGLMLTAENPYATGSEWDILLELPEELEGQTELRMKVKCAWSRPAANPRYYDSGFSILECDATTRDAITLLVRFYAFRK